MILESVSVDRFRGFKRLRLSPLDRFNLIIGRNNVGKTALLEAVFLLVGPTNPELPLRLSVLRGIEQFRNEPEDLWGWLFYGKDISSEVVLRASIRPGKSRTLRISVKERTDVRVTSGSKRTIELKRDQGMASTAAGPSELVLSFHDEKGKRHVSKAYITDKGVGYHTSQYTPLPSCILISSRGGYNPDNAERYSKLEEAGREKELLPSLRVLEPRLKRLAVLVTGAIPIIHADIGIDRMVPLPFMGEGLGRLLTILLAISYCKGGVVMIDEIETGLHYSVMTQVWTAIAQAARDFDAQIIATSHSFECLKAAYDSFKESSLYDFRLHRLDRNDGDVETVHYDRDMIEIAIKSGLEIR